MRSTRWAVLAILVAQVVLSSAYPVDVGLEPDISGLYTRTSCSCDSKWTDLKCDDLTTTQYRISHRLSSNTYSTSSWIGRSTTSSTNAIAGYLGNGVVFIPAPQMTCEGSFANIVCRDDTPEKNIACTLSFACEQGPCIANVVTTNLRSVMYPILGIVLGIFWILIVALPILRGLLSNLAGLIVLALSGAQFVLMFFVLFTPAAFVGLMFMFTAAMQVFAALQAHPRWWMWCSALAIWNFLAFIGMNWISAPVSFAAVPFDYLFFITSARGCMTYYDIGDADVRCHGFMAFTLFNLFFCIFIQPVIAFLAMVNWKADSKKESV